MQQNPSINFFNDFFVFIIFQNRQIGISGMDRIREKLKPGELIGLMAWLVGLQPHWSPMTIDNFVASFNWDLIPREDITVDAAALF